MPPHATAFLRCVWVAVVGLLCSLNAAQAQEVGEGDDGALGAFGRIGDFQAGGVSYHFFAQPGEATVQVMVLSSSGAGGIYEVGVGTNLGELIALTGGAPLGSETSEAVQEVSLELYRGGEGTRALIYEAELEEALVEPGRYPPLRDGDVLLIEVVQRNKFSWRDALSIVTTAAGLLLLLDRIFNFLGTRRN